MNLLDQLPNLKTSDSGKMSDLIQSLPSQLEEGTKLASSLSFPSSYSDFNAIVFSGMGGSAISSDIVGTIIRDQISVPFVVNRDYHLPPFTSSKTLFIALSYSGNTEEVLSSFEEARSKKAKIIVLASGGKLLELAKQYDIPVVQIPSGLPPRTAVGYGIGSILAFFSKMGLIDAAGIQRDLKEAVKLLRDLNQSLYGIPVSSDKNPVKQAAQNCLQRIPVIYSGPQLESIAYRLRSQVEENAKSLAFHHVIPEMTHNEIAGWHKSRDWFSHLAVILLKDREDHPRVTQRMNYVKKVLSDLKVPVMEWTSQGQSRIARMLSLFSFGDWFSFYLALLYQADPFDIKAIEDVKVMLQQKGPGV